MQWHQLDHMQAICTSILTDNHINTSSLNFYRTDALPDTQPTASTHRKPMCSMRRNECSWCAYWFVPVRSRVVRRACVWWGCMPSCVEYLQAAHDWDLSEPACSASSSDDNACTCNKPTHASYTSRQTACEHLYLVLLVFPSLFHSRLKTFLFGKSFPP